MLDIFSRYVVGWWIETVESGDFATKLVAESCGKQGIAPCQLILHADNGVPMTSKPLATLLSTFGITRSHNRPHPSNDNSGLNLLSVHYRLSDSVCQQCVSRV